MYWDILSWIIENLGIYLMFIFFIFCVILFIGGIASDLCGFKADKQYQEAVNIFKKNDEDKKPTD